MPNFQGLTLFFEIVRYDGAGKGQPKESDKRSDIVLEPSPRPPNKGGEREVSDCDKYGGFLVHQ